MDEVLGKKVVCLRICKKNWKCLMISILLVGKHGIFRIVDTLGPTSRIKEKQRIKECS
jgi:hypothetical protein